MSCVECWLSYGIAMHTRVCCITQILFCLSTCIIRDFIVPWYFTLLWQSYFQFLACAFQNALNKKWSANINQMRWGEAHAFFISRAYLSAERHCELSVCDLVVISTAAWLQLTWYIGYFYIWWAICVTDFAIHAACWRTSFETDLRAVFSR